VEVADAPDGDDELLGTEEVARRLPPLRRAAAYLGRLLRTRTLPC
jgi:hypothetical protein